MDAGRNVTTAVTTAVNQRPPTRASPTKVQQSYVRLKTPGFALFVRSAFTVPGCAELESQLSQSAGLIRLRDR
jgi:hypothetical protein